MRRSRRRKLSLRGGGRLLGVAASVLVLAWLAWEIIANSTATMLAQEEPESALAWRPGNATALVRLGERQFAKAHSTDDLMEAESAAIAALKASPLEGRALRLLAFIADARGTKRRATALMNLAVRRSLRDAYVHGWWFDHLVAEGQFIAALTHVDLVLRTNPQLRAMYLQDLMKLVSEPRSAGAVVDLLARNPPWREWFLSEFSRNARDLSAPTMVYKALQFGPNPPNARELKPHLEQLIKVSQFAEAFMLWRRFLPADQLQNGTLIYNGDFNYPITNLPFDWMFGDVPGATIGLANAPAREGQALRVEFAMGRTPFRHVQKLLMLVSGTYQLSGWVMAEDLRTPRGLWWRLVCAEGQQEILAETERMAGTSAWREFREKFTVPANNCRAQWLRLELAARIALEQQVDGGRVWYDNLQITRIMSEADRAAGRD